MKKSLLVFFLLLVLSVSTLTAAHGAITQLQDDVTITETTLAGDPAAADGLTVSLDTALREHLFWHTTYHAGTDPAAETDFTFSSTPVPTASPVSEYVYLETGNVFFGISGHISDLQNDVSLTDYNGAPYMVLAAIDVADRIPAGQTRTETVNLHDYYPYYTVGLLFDTGETFGTPFFPYKINIRQEINDALAQYFRIPVPEDAWIQIQISKDNTGAICDVTTASVDSVLDDSSGTASTAPAINADNGLEFSLSSDGIVTEEGFYLILWTDADMAAQAFSEIAGGYGVYFIPISQPAESELYIEIDRIQNIYPLDPETSQAVSLMESEDETQLLLFIREQEQMTLTVLDRETWEPVQQLSLPTGSILSSLQGDDVLILHLWDDGSYRFVALCREDGLYSLWLDAPMTEWFTVDPNTIYLYGNPGFCFDGQRLAIAYQTPYADASSLCVMVYGQTGLLYAGQYLHNGDQISPRMQNPAWADSSMTLRWE